MMMRSTFCTAVITVIVLFCPRAAFGISKLDCIADSKGKKVRWLQYWENDKRDNDTIYKIVNVSEVDKIPTREVTLELQADGPASASFRKVVVSTEEKARAICERLVVEEKRLEFPVEESANLEKLPFIHFTRDGWVRADVDLNAQLGVCRIGDQRFSCPESDRQRFGGTLKAVEDQLHAQVK